MGGGRKVGAGGRSHLLAESPLGMGASRKGCCPGWAGGEAEEEGSGDDPVERLGGERGEVPVMGVAVPSCVTSLLKPGGGATLRSTLCCPIIMPESGEAGAARTPSMFAGVAFALTGFQELPEALLVDRPGGAEPRLLPRAP